MTHLLNHRLMYSVLTGWLNHLLTILQVFRNKRWCWVPRSQPLACLCHLGFGSHAPFLNSKGNLSSRSLSQDISQPQKSITGLYFGREFHAGVSRASWWVLCSGQAMEWSQHLPGKQILWQRLISDRKLETLVLYVNTCIRGCT